MCSTSRLLCLKLILSKHGYTYLAGNGTANNMNAAKDGSVVNPAPPLACLPATQAWLQPPLSRYNKARPAPQNLLPPSPGCPSLMPTPTAKPRGMEVLTATRRQPRNVHAGVQNLQEGSAQDLHVEELPQTLQQGVGPGGGQKGLLGAGAEPAMQGVVQAQHAGSLIGHGKHSGMQCQNSVTQGLGPSKEPASIGQAPAPALGRSASPEANAHTSSTLAHPSGKRTLLPPQSDRPTRKPRYADPAAGAALVGKHPATATPERALTPTTTGEPAVLLPVSDPAPVAAAAHQASAVHGWLGADVQVDSSSGWTWDVAFCRENPCSILVWT